MRVWTYSQTHAYVYIHRWECMDARLNAPVHVVHARMRCVSVCEGSVCPRDMRGGPSGHPCHAEVPVKCCQRGRCGLLWRLEACCTALPAHAADLRKGNLGRLNGGVAPKLFTEPSTGPAPPTIIHMRSSVCVWCLYVCVCVSVGWLSL